MKQKYHLIVERSRKKFDEEVTKYMHDGWKLHGSPQGNVVVATLYWAQAVHFVYCEGDNYNGYGKLRINYENKTGTEN